MANWYLTEYAKNNLKEILTGVIAYTGYVASGIRLQEEIFERLDLLSYFPESGRKRPEERHREVIVRGYRIVYKIIEENVAVVTIIHSSRLYPRPDNLK